MATTDGEIDTCRICSAPAEEGQPLFYPCKCSGTIRYIHQDCLTTWLAHSKKRSCDVCKYEYSFTKVYKADMPKRLPPKLFLKKLSTQMARVVIMSLRLVMISIIWLAMLPYLTLLVWRFYFWTGEALAYWVVGQELPDRSPTPPQQLNTTNVSQPPTDNSTLAPLPPSEHTWLNVLPQDLGADIFKGQVITIAVVIVFLTIFLLREWIIQNARPGVFGDEEVLEGGVAAPEGALPEVVEEMPALVEVDANPVPPPINNPIMDAAPDIAAEFEEDEEIGDQSAGVVPGLGEREHAALPLDPDPEEEWEDESSDTNSEPTYARGEGESSTSTQRKRKERDVDESAVSGMLFQTGSEQTTIQASQTTRPASPVVESATLVPPSEPVTQDPELKDVTTSKASFELENDLSLPSSFAFSSPTGASQSLTHSIESSLDGTRPPSSYMSSSSSTVATESQIQSSIANFPFTFTPPVAESATDMSQMDLQPAPTPGPFPTFFGASGTSTSRLSLAPPSPNRAAPTPLPFPLTPQPVAGPSGIRRATKISRPKIPPKHMSASTPAFDRNTTEFDEFRFSFSSTPTTLSQSSSRHSSRPPLPPSTPGVDEPLPSTTVSGTSSPGLALYRPPEDLSSGLGYFDRGAVAKASAQDLEAMFNPQPEQRPDSEPRDSNTVVGEPVADEPIIPEPELDEEVVAQAVGDFVQAIAQPRGVPPAPVLQEEDDVEEEVQDVEPMGDDDMDGALEAIGVRGPIMSVFQNVFLMIFIIDLAIAVGVWMPFTMGKTTALLFLKPEDVLAIVRFPIIVVRVLTDPVVDGLVFLLNLLARPLRWGMTSLIPAAVPVAKKAAVVPAAPKLSLNFTVVQDAILHHWDRLIEHSQAAANVSIPRPSPTNAVERIVFRLPAPSVRSLESIESRFAALGRAARLFSHAFARRWQQLAVADGTSERAFAISLGYLVLTLVMGIYLGVLNAGAVRGAARALRNAVKQQLIVIKRPMLAGRHVKCV
ncbi:hypothetical protein FRC12_006318 [Ceratobasidium sp. 428]|nr:hypothetical protein FRC12_006318 [Ceratobasidium sp. 428]